MATRWQSSAKWTLVAVVAVVVLGGAAFWFFVLRGDAPERARLPVSTTETTDGAAPPPTTAADAPATLDGTYEVVTGPDVFAGYRVQELFGGETIKKTAVGRTGAVTGSLTIVDGRVTGVEIEVDMTQLESDNGTRDNQLRGRGLETDDFPTATFELTDPVDLPADVDAGQVVELEAVGDLTLHGVTRTVTVALQASWDGAVTISVATPSGVPILMADYDIEPPNTPLVSVDDNGELELQVVFTRA
jgi:polyisoprenoid-binding protein YceI